MLIFNVAHRVLEAMTHGTATPKMSLRYPRDNIYLE